MAYLRGTVEKGGSEKVSALGTLNTGLSARLNTWGAGIEVSAERSRGDIVFSVWETTGSCKTTSMRDVRIRKLATVTYPIDDPERKDGPNV